MPLSEHEQKVLQQLEQALYREDPAYAARLKSENVYRYAGRYVKWSVAGFIVGLAVTVAFFTASTALGFIGVAIMFASLVVGWNNLRRMGKAGWDDLSRTLPEGIGSALSDTRSKLRDRFRRQK